MSISDIIEQYLKKRLHNNDKKYVEIRRSEIADQFQCVPSQINYVINTRFTLEKGYLIESKRGGGGYIRDRKSTRMNSSHVATSYAVFCLQKNSKHMM